MVYKRFLDKSTRPGEDEILRALGLAAPIWLDICKYIRSHYAEVPEMIFFTKNYGWSVRYRKSKKTLCYLFPERNAFSVLIVLGSKEAVRAEDMAHKMNEAVRRVLEDTEQLHDGRWLWIRVTEASDCASLKVLLSAKKKPAM